MRGLGRHGRHDEDEGEHEHLRQDQDAVGDEGGQAATLCPISCPELIMIEAST